MKKLNSIKWSTGVLILFILTHSLNSQEITQVIKGRVFDSETQLPLSFATVTVITTNPQVGVTTNEDGYFRLKNVPVGRHNILISYLGYENKLLPELMITSGKEMVLNIGLKEKVTNVEEVTIKAFARKDKPLNSMSLLSARTFSVEEAQRYAGGFDDPARLASSFAGVSTSYLDDNGIIVRGNAPKGLLWRLEGIEIPNPNHFAGMTSFGGGGVSALSSLMLANSDFFTGAFPAEYGNASSGVFDIKLRTGNNEKHEHAIQFGALGLDLSSEGPLSKNNGASYLFNYRYSTFGIIKPVLPEEANIPVYQDLCIKINMPTQKSGTFSVWALATDDKIKFEADEDTSLWNYEFDREIGEAVQRMGAIGINHIYNVGQKSYLTSSLAATGDYTLYDGGMLDYDMTRHPSEHIDNTNYRYTFTSVLNHKFSAKHSNRSGFIYNNLHYKTILEFAPNLGDELVTASDEDGASDHIQLFSQSSYSINEQLKLNLGVNGQYFELNKETIIEPRAGLTYQLSPFQSISLAYGKHSRMEPLGLYFGRVNNNGEIEHPNKSLRLSKSHHMVLAYDLSLSANARLKIEPYIQLQYDIPVIPDSSYSTVNMEADWYFTDKLTNDGTGTNYGIDLTLERFLKDGYYYLITTSLFDSKYKGGDNIERPTRYDMGYVANILLGKEWVLGESKNKILGVNTRLNIQGGQKITPVNFELSKEAKEVIYDNSRVFEDQKPNVYHLNTSITYRINKENHSGIWALQVMNALGTKEFYGYAYNAKTGKIDRDETMVVVPSISYKIEF